MNGRKLRSSERKSIARFAQTFSGARQLAALSMPFMGVLAFFAPALVLAGVIALLLHVGPVNEFAQKHRLIVDGLQCAGLLFPNTHQGPFNVYRQAFGAINSTRQIPLPRTPGGMLKWLMVRMNGSLVISAGSTNGTLTGESPAGFIQKLIFNAPSAGRYPGGDLINATPRSLILMRLFDKEQVIRDTSLTGAAGTFTLDVPIWLRFSRPDAPRPFDTALPMDQYQSLQLKAQVASGPTVFVGSDRTFDFSGVNIDTILNTEIQTSGDRGKDVIFVQDDTILVAAANKRLPYNQFPTDGAMADLQFYTESTAANTLVDTVLNQVIASYGGVQFLNLFRQDINRIDLDYVLAGAIQTGFYRLPFNEDQLNKSALRIQKAGDLALELDVANPGGANLDRVTFISERIFWREDHDPIG